MSSNRAIRYKEKITYILECIQEIEEVLPHPTGIVLKGVYYNLSSAIESTMEMIAMLCKDSGLMPKGDYENIQSLRNRNIIEEQLAERLIRCNGLRNVLVHQYNGIEDQRVIDSIEQVHSDLKDFIKIVEGHLGEH